MSARPPSAIRTIATHGIRSRRDRSRDDRFDARLAAEPAAASATFRVLAKGDLDADAALASAVGFRRRRGR